ncbi:MAG: helix-hairpin-helix domain-containing protein [Azonexus sp.]|nr:helix-hairpin-helix domain-containing protein [Azonexus sp.]
MTNQISSGIETSIGENHGYCFEGDFVYLNAEVNFSDADLAACQSWALQLWASDNGFDGLQTAGIKVAELDVQPMAGGLATAGWCGAMPPAGAVDQVLGLALVTFGADGQPQIRDLAVYPSRESFFQPTLVGNVACMLTAGTAELNIDAIANPRDNDNLSGTLALEVWALDAPYAGGSWSGSPVATVILGVLGGGSAWADCQFSVPAALPVEGSALTVMLREWTPAGYVTRDYRNFAAAPAKIEAVTKPKPAAKAKPVAKPKAAVAAKPAAAEKPAVAVKAPVAEAKAAAKPVKKVASAKEAVKLVSINKASEDELAALKGLPREVARAIIASRPYAALDEVVKAKGMGLKKLAKLRDLLAL